MATFDPSVATGPVRIGGEVSDNDEFIEQLGMLATAGARASQGFNLITDGLQTVQETKEKKDWLNAIDSSAPLIAKESGMDENKIRQLMLSGKWDNKILQEQIKTKYGARAFGQYLKNTLIDEGVDPTSDSNEDVDVLGIPSSVDDAPNSQPPGDYMSGLPYDNSSLPEASAGGVEAPVSATTGASSNKKSKSGVRPMRTGDAQLDAESDAIFDSIPDSSFEKLLNVIAQDVIDNPEAAEGYYLAFGDFLNPEKLNAYDASQRARAEQVIKAFMYPRERVNEQRKLDIQEEKASNQKSFNFKKLFMQEDKAEVDKEKSKSQIKLNEAKTEKIKQGDKEKPIASKDVENVVRSLSSDPSTAGVFITLNAGDKRLLAQKYLEIRNQDPKAASDLLKDFAANPQEVLSQL